MKTKVIALLLSIVLASGSIGTAPVYAAEADLEESVPEQEEEEKPEEEEAPTTKMCPYCMCDDVAIGATKCPHCASVLPVEETAEQA